MNWTHLVSQVECMVIDSMATPEEFKDILSDENWYKHEVWRTKTWWFGHKGELSEVTFEQLRGLFGWMGMDVDVLMGAMRYQLAEMVDELIKTEEEEVTEKEDMAA